MAGCVPYRCWCTINWCWGDTFWAWTKTQHLSRHLYASSCCANQIVKMYKFLFAWLHMFVPAILTGSREAIPNMFGM